MAGATLANGNSQPEATTNMISTDILIIGAGPAGASLACFLAFHGKLNLEFSCGPFNRPIILILVLGIHGIMVSSASTHADTPRAHITNMAALG